MKIFGYGTIRKGDKKETTPKTMTIEDLNKELMAKNMVMINMWKKAQVRG